MSDNLNEKYRLKCNQTLVILSGSKDLLFQNMPIGINRHRFYNTMHFSSFWYIDCINIFITSNTRQQHHLNNNAILARKTFTLGRLVVYVFRHFIFSTRCRCMGYNFEIKYLRHKNVQMNCIYTFIVIRRLKYATPPPPALLSNTYFISYEIIIVAR